MKRDIAMKLHGMFTTAVFSGALVFGGLNVAVAHHGNFEDHTTTKAKTKAQAERMERRITSELNQKSLMVAQAAPQSPIMAPQGPMMSPAPPPPPAPQGDQAALIPAEPAAGVAAVEEQAPN
jgi:hypothetical protein